MTSPYRGNEPIVVGVDDSPASLKAVRWATLTAIRHRCPVQLVHAAGFTDPYLIGFTVPPPEAFKTELQQQKRRSLEQAEDVAAELGAPQVRTRFDTDAAIPALLHASGSARMIVVGSSGRTGLAGLMVGSTTIALVSHARCPVVAVRDDHADAIAGDDRPVVVGIDGSKLSEAAVGYAFEEASFRGADLIAVHTWSDTDASFFNEPNLLVNWEPIRDYESRRLAERLAGWQEHYPDVRIQRHLARDRPRHELLERSRSAQLVVVGSRGRGGFRGMLLGSTSQALVHHSACPVMIVRPERG